MPSRHTALVATSAVIGALLAVPSTRAASTADGAASPNTAATAAAPPTAAAPGAALANGAAALPAAGSTAQPAAVGGDDAATASAHSLQALLRSALSADPQVQAAQLLLQATESRSLAARSRLGPNLGVNITKGYGDVEESGSAFNRRTDRTDAALRWNLYNGGADWAEWQASQRDVAVAQQDLRRAREESSERIADAYLDLQRLSGLLPLAEQRLTGVQRLVALVQRQNALGKAADTDAQQARASLLEAEMTLDQVEAERNAAREKLAQLTGQDVRQLLPVTLPTLADGLPLSRPNGQLAGARLRAEAARQRVPRASSLWTPRVDAEMRQNLGDHTTPRNTTVDQRSWQLTARWDFALGGEAVARRDESARRADAAEAEAERIARTLRTELQALLPRLDQAERAVARLDGQIEQYQALVRAGELQFEAGRRTLSQLIDLGDKRYAAEQRRADQVYRLAQGQLRRLALTGNLLPALLGEAASE